MNVKPDIDDLAAAIRAGNRAALGRGITLVESHKSDHEARAQALLNRLLPDTGKAIRLGITGVPGSGKSTTIDTLGSTLTGAGHKVAVLAVDPTSQRTGGSILGDKTRMARLAADDNAFIRPSPAGATLGGVARRTRETMLLCEAAGHDVIIVETVGIGQSETAVADMVDFFMVLQVAGAGDDLQGLKKGVIELADLIAINKADGDNKARADNAAADLKAALGILMPVNPLWQPPVLTISGLHDIGLDLVWDQVTKHRAIMEQAGEFAARRERQQVKWFWSILEDRLFVTLRRHATIEPLIERLEADVRATRITPSAAARAILERISFR